MRRAVRWCLFAVLGVALPITAQADAAKQTYRAALRALETAREALVQAADPDAALHGAGAVEKALAELRSALWRVVDAGASVRVPVGRDQNFVWGAGISGPAGSRGRIVFRKAPGRVRG